MDSAIKFAHYGQGNLVDYIISTGRWLGLELAIVFSDAETVKRLYKKMYRTKQIGDRTGADYVALLYYRKIPDVDVKNTLWELLKEDLKTGDDFDVYSFTLTAANANNKYTRWLNDISAWYIMNIEGIFDDDYIDEYAKMGMLFYAGNSNRYGKEQDLETIPLDVDEKELKRFIDTVLFTIQPSSYEANKERFGAVIEQSVKDYRASSVGSMPIPLYVLL